ncbi:hypothetical protein F4804DRAFT_332801 [Jackrogersella minutella]|nr:hypothetical protein F4804DRAFT_332801 [Jackrogersella minutella]
MDLIPNLKALGLYDLADITLEDLENKIDHVQHGRLSRQQVLQTLMGWLHERITRDIQQKSLLSDFVNLLLTRGKLQQAPFSESEVEAAFEEWQTKDAAENPANRRRYQMILLDIRELLENGMISLNSEDDASPKLSSPSQNQAFSTFLDKPINPHTISKTNNWESNHPRVIGGKQKTGANIIPLGQRKASRSNINGIHYNIYKAMEENNKRYLTKTATNEVPPVERTANSVVGKIASKDITPTKANKSIFLDLSPKALEQFSRPPPLSYVCNRCEEPGHWIQLCPTNLDPSWDRPPPPDYRCELCLKWGEHFATLCPMNTKSVSLTKQRQRHEARLKAEPGTPTRDKNINYRDRGRLTPLSRRRSRSPINHPRQTRHDIYRPDDSPRGNNDFGVRQRSSGNRDISPWTARERVTGKLQRMEDHNREYNSDSHRRRERSATPPRKHPYRRARGGPPPEERLRPYRDLKMTQKETDGRLSYDNDVFMSFDASSATPKESTLSKPKAMDTKDRVMTDAPMVAKDMSEEIEQAQEEAERFLDALAAEYPFNKAPIQSNKPGPVRTVYSGDKMDIDDENAESGASKNNLTPSKTADPRAEWSPELKALFKNLEDPIVKKRSKRKTAAEMFNEAYVPTCPPTQSERQY